MQSPPHIYQTSWISIKVNESPIACWGLVLYMPAGHIQVCSKMLCCEVLDVWGKKLLGQLQLVLQSLCAFSGQILISLTLGRSCVHCAAPDRDSARGAKWQSVHYGNTLSGPPPLSPRERDDGPFVSAQHRRDGPTRCLPVEFPSFSFQLWTSSSPPSHRV